VNALPIPERIHRDDREVVITWAADHVGRYAARYLRLECLCAVCRDELTGRRLLDPDAVPEDVKPVVLSLVGSYAIRVDWSDGHNTGIYTYEYLRKICPCAACSSDRRTVGPAS
jgi:DUF971 family protein